MIVYSIVVTALLMASMICLGYEHSGRIKTEERLSEREQDLFEARQQICSYQIEKANRDGVEAGRVSDTMYKNFLSQFSAGEQVTVMFRRDNAEYYAPKHQG